MALGIKKKGEALRRSLKNVDCVGAEGEETIHRFVRL